MKKPRFRVSIFVKLVSLLALILTPLAMVTWYASVRTLRDKMTDEFVSKGTAIANTLAASGAELILTRDASTVQAAIDQYVSIPGVAYVMVYDPAKTLIAHTFHPVVPPALIDKNLVPGDVTKQVREVVYEHPVTGATRRIIDIGVPMLGGTLGTVRVGMDRSNIDAAAEESGRFLFSVFGAVAFVAVAAGAVFARRVSQRVNRIVRVAERVGRGDLSQTADVRTHDEVGQLARTFNETIVRLRSQVTTEAERDDERRKREDLQKNITKFLDTVTEISQGDLRRRGEVTPDILGNVVDSINVMVEEIGTLLGDVRHAAGRLAGSATDMIGATEQVARGAETQSREATTIAREMEDMTRSVRHVAANAEASADAARQALEAAQAGDRAVRDTLAGMQKIRAEVQVIAKKIKSLGDRSLEISEIAGTIDEIASQTNLLALNAAIEAAGAGEAGTRFAVVADEIRKLAERSTKATRDIAGLIKTVQAETQEAVVAMEEGTREVEAGHQVTLSAEQHLKQIAGVSETSAQLAERISSATRDQVRGAEGVATAMQSIAAAAVQTEEAVLQTRRTVEDLVKLADELTRSLARFKLAV